MIRIQIARLPHGEGLPLPAYATAHAAGMDVVAAEDTRRFRSLAAALEVTCTARIASAESSAGPRWFRRRTRIARPSRSRRSKCFPSDTSNTPNPRGQS